MALHLQLNLGRNVITRGYTSSAVGPRRRVMVRASPGDDDEAGAQKRGKKVGIKGKNLADDILDFALAGPKMRRWYNEEEDEGLEAVKGPKRSGEDGEEEDEGPRSQVLVVGGDTAMGDAVIMQLILGREEVAAHVRNAEETRVKYAKYVTPLSMGLDSPAMGRALKKAKCVVCCGPVSSLPKAAADARVGHLVCLSVADSGGGIPFFGGNDDAQLDASIVSKCRASGVPTTVVSVQRISSKPLVSSLTFAASGSPEGSVSREDVATVVARCAGAAPPDGVREVVVREQGRGEPQWAQLEEVLQ